MHSYDVYGLGICSEVPVPAFAVGTGRADVIVRKADLRDLVEDLRSSHRAFAVAKTEIRMNLHGIGSFVVRGGVEVLVDPAPGADFRWVQLAIVGPVLAAILVQRGFLILHASCVAVGGRAVAFLGAPLQGKSTLAAALHVRGHPLVTDDITAIRFESGIPLVFPGFPQFKLWPDALAAMGGNADELPRIAPASEKRAKRLDPASLSTAPVPLGRIYVLSSSEAVVAEPVPAGAAYLELVRHSYGVHWLHDFASETHFFARARLAAEVPIRYLRRPRDLALLPPQAMLVENEMEAHLPRSLMDHEPQHALIP